MNGIRYINPFSKSFHSLQDFKQLFLWQRFITIMVSIIITPVTFALGTTPVFRALVGRFTKINLIKSSETTKKTNEAAQSTLTGLGNQDSEETMPLVAIPMPTGGLALSTKDDPSSTNPAGKNFRRSEPQELQLDNYQVGGSYVRGLANIREFIDSNSNRFALFQVDGTLTLPNGQTIPLNIKKGMGLTILQNSNQNFDSITNAVRRVILGLEASLNNSFQNSELVPRVKFTQLNNDIRSIIPKFDPSNRGPQVGNFLVAEPQVFQVTNYKIGKSSISGLVNIRKLTDSRGHPFALLQTDGTFTLRNGKEIPVKFEQVAPLDRVLHPAELLKSIEAALKAQVLRLEASPSCLNVELTQEEVWSEVADVAYSEIDEAEIDESELEELSSSFLSSDFSQSSDFSSSCILGSSENEIESIKLNLMKPMDDSCFDINLENLSASDDLSDSCIADFEVLPSSSSRAEERAAILVLEGTEALKDKPSFNLLGDMIQLSQYENLSDSTWLVYSESGKLEEDRNKSNGIVPQKTIAIFKESIKSTFGCRLGDLIYNRYFTGDNPGHCTLETLTYGDFKKAFVGAAALVGESELKELFSAIKEDNDGEMLCRHLLSPEMTKQISSVENFEALSVEQLRLLYSCFTTILTPKGYSSTFTGVLYRANLKVPSTNFDYFFHDAELLCKIHHHPFFDTQDIKLSLSEHLGKKLVYSELRKDAIVPMQNDSGNFCHYKVESILDKKGDGVHSNLIVPINLQNNYSTEENDNLDVFLNFRGTCPDPSQEDAGQTVFRDLEFEGVGAASFARRAEEIAKMVEDYLEKADTPSNVTVNIAGHSLGACDAQRALLVIMQKIDSSVIGSPWRKVKKIELKTHNAPKLEKRAADQMVEIHNSLAAKVAQDNLELHIDATHVRFFDKATEDIVGWFGDMLAGANTQDSKLFSKRIIKVTLNKLEGTAGFLTAAGGAGAGLLPRHTTKVYSLPPSMTPEFEQEIIDQGEDLEKLLACNHHWKDISEADYQLMLRQHLRWAAGNAYLVPRNLVHYAVGKAFIPIVRAATVITQKITGTQPRAHQLAAHMHKN